MPVYLINLYVHVQNVHELYEIRHFSNRANNTR